MYADHASFGRGEAHPSYHRLGVLERSAQPLVLFLFFLEKKGWWYVNEEGRREGVVGFI
jgi:hypothetical protein